MRFPFDEFIRGPETPWLVREWRCLERKGLLKSTVQTHGFWLAGRRNDNTPVRVKLSLPLFFRAWFGPRLCLIALVEWSVLLPGLPQATCSLGPARRHPRRI